MAVRPISKWKRKGKTPSIRKATSSTKIQPHFSQEADRPDTATSTSFVVSLQPISNVILGRGFTCSTPVLSKLTDEAVLSSSTVVPRSTQTPMDNLHHSKYMHCCNT
jgi:hypothetical protein